MVVRVDKIGGESTAAKLHDRMIDRLKTAGVPSDYLWLCEGSEWKLLYRFYPADLIYDFETSKPAEHNGVIYYHESGEIHSFESFVIGDDASEIKAAEKLAEYFEVGIDEG